MAMRKLVVPGDFIAEDENARLDTPFMFRENSKIYSAVLGLVEIEEENKKGSRIKIIPLAGRYIPKVGDFVIGVVASIQNSLWITEIFSPYKAALNESDFIDERKWRRESEDLDELKQILPVGSIIYAKVREVSASKRVFLTLKEKPAKILKDGHITAVSPVKVPRIIGRKSSMINMIKEETKCNIVVGQNGIIWISGKEKNIEIATSAVKEIEKRSHVQGLTESIKKMIEEMREKNE